MKFFCGSCKKLYQIPDEKIVPGKFLAIHCKRCGARLQIPNASKNPNEIPTAPVLPPEGFQYQPESSQNPPISESSAPSEAVHMGGAATETPLSGMQEGSPPQDDPEAMMASFLGDDDPRGSQSEPATRIAPRPADARAGLEWYAAIDGEQCGPFAYPEMVERVRKGELGGDTYIWNEQLDGWKLLRDEVDLYCFSPELNQANAEPEDETPFEASAPAVGGSLVDPPQSGETFSEAPTALASVDASLLDEAAKAVDAPPASVSASVSAPVSESPFDEVPSMLSETPLEVPEPASEPPASTSEEQRVSRVAEGDPDHLLLNTRPQPMIQEPAEIRQVAPAPDSSLSTGTQKSGGVLIWVILAVVLAIVAVAVLSFVMGGSGSEASSLLEPSELIEAWLRKA